MEGLEGSVALVIYFNWYLSGISGYPASGNVCESPLYNVLGFKKFKHISIDNDINYNSLLSSNCQCSEMAF